MCNTTGDSYYLEIVCPDGDIYQSFLYLKEIIFDRSYFWKERTKMFTFNFDFQNCQNFVAKFVETSPALKYSSLRNCIIS